MQLSFYVDTHEDMERKERGRRERKEREEGERGRREMKESGRAKNTIDNDIEDGTGQGIERGK